MATGIVLSCYDVAWILDEFDPKLFSVFVPSIFLLDCALLQCLGLCGAEGGIDSVLYKCLQRQAFSNSLWWFGLVSLNLPIGAGVIRRNVSVSDFVSIYKDSKFLRSEGCVVVTYYDLRDAVGCKQLPENSDSCFCGC